MKDLPLGTCPWSLSGPQFPQPTAIQQRYCYPKGNPDYAGRKGGALWTMYGANGKEDFQYRLLHVYFSAKRAVNKGVELSAEDRWIQKLQDDAASAASMSTSIGSPKHKKTKRVARAVRSPWQERSTSQRHRGKRKLPSNGRSVKRLRCPPSPIAASSLVKAADSNRQPFSPFQASQFLVETVHGSIHVSPNTAASSAEERQSSYGHPFDSSYFDIPPFHPVASFDGNESTKGADLQKNKIPFRKISETGALQRHCQQATLSIDQNDSFEFSEAAATMIGGHHDTIPAWNDPLLPLEGKPSFDDNFEQQKKTANTPPVIDGSSAEKLKIRLGRIHEALREGILAHHGSSQGPLLSIVASWGRSLAQNPLVPTFKLDDSEPNGTFFKTISEPIKDTATARRVRPEPGVVATAV